MPDRSEQDRSSGEGELIDAHVHLMALDDGSNGCHISPRLLHGPLAWLMRRRLQLSPEAGPTELNAQYLQRLRQRLAESRFVSRAVVLPLDAVHDADGTPRLEKSSLVVSNDYALEVSRRHGELLPAASVHPFRRDALEELERVSEAGAVLVKLLPVSQLFDPSDPRTRLFWRTCARLGLPALVHTGWEFTLAGHRQRYGDPALLELALSQGVTVIAAHACSHGLPLFPPHLETFRRLAVRYPEFLADSSALTLPGRTSALLRLRREPQLVERLTFGTDFPIPPSVLPLVGRVSPATLWRIQREANPFDKPVRVFRALGIEPSSEPLRRRLPARAE